MKLFDDAEDEQKIWKVREGGLGATAWVPGSRSPGRAGKTPPCRPRRSAPTCATSASCSTSTTTPALCTATSARAASTAASTSTWTPPRASRSSAPSWTRPPTWSSRYGGSLSGEHGDGQAQAELLPKMFGDGADPGVPRVQVDLGSRLEDEPRQGRAPYRIDREPAPGHRLRPAGACRRTSTSRRTRTASAGSTLRCVGVGECRRARRAARCVPATG